MDSVKEAQTADAAVEPSAPTPPALNINFMDLAGDPLSDLTVRVTVRKQTTTYTTDLDGNLPAILASAQAPLRIEVQRFDGTFKTIDDGCTVNSGAVWNYLSPQLVFETETQLHEGQPGAVEAHIPKPTATDEGDRPATYDEPSTEAAAVSSAAVAPNEPLPAAMPVHGVPPPAAKPVLGPTATSQYSKPSPAAVPATVRTGSGQLPQITGGSNQPVRDDKPKAGRGAEGHPMTVFEQKVKNWWNSWSLPTLSIWHARGGASGVSVAVDVNVPAVANGKQAGSKVPYHPSMLPKVKALIEFAQEQTTYLYANSEGTAAVVAAMAKKTFTHVPKEKEGSVSLGKCYQYVRIALTRAQIVTGYVADGMAVSYQESASNAGEPLTNKGFMEVTDEVPDARWAATGDVIVYQWSPGTWEARKSKKGNPALPNHGHIDIRSEETYISDFMPGAPEGFHPRWIAADAGRSTKYRPEYVNIRIYRKFYDPTPTCRIRAFLACLREFECQDTKDDAGRYQVLKTPLPSAPKSKTFSGFEKHPWDAVPKEQWPTSTAAGAYQITCTVWREEMERMYFADVEGKAKFTPQIQDRVAVRRLEFRKVLHLVRSGKLDAAVTAARSEWTSLPGSTENSGRRTADGKPMDMAYLKGLYEKFLSGELAKFGIGAK